MDKMKEICDAFSKKLKRWEQIDKLKEQKRDEKARIEINKGKILLWSIGIFLQIPAIIFPANMFFCMFFIMAIFCEASLIKTEMNEIRDSKDNILKIEDMIDYVENKDQFPPALQKDIDI